MKSEKNFVFFNQQPTTNNQQPTTNRKMSGIYLHIPFCKKACHYCDFHFSTSLKNKSSFLKALEHELILRAGEFKSQTVETIYFGGGTPSILEVDDIKAILKTN